MKGLYQKINFRKIVNLIVLKLSYWFSILTKKPHVWSKPTAVSIEPLNYCNLACPECFAGNGNLMRDKQLLEPDCFQKIINQLPAAVSYITFYFQGEPFLHPEFAGLVCIANKRNIFTATSTNGHFLTDRDKTKGIISSGLDRIIVSIDGTTQEVYEKYRKNGKLQKVIDGVKTLVELKKELRSKTPYIEIQFLVMAHNEHQVSEMKELAKSLEIDELTFKSTQIYEFENGSELMPKDEKYCRYYKDKDGKYYIKGKLKNRCWRQWSCVVITASGDVLPCCFDKNGAYSFGNVFEHTFNEIWHGKKANEFRKAILNNRKDIDICKNCTEV